MAKAEDLKTKEECIEWVRKRTPFAIKPKGKAKTTLIYPFTSHHSFLEVTKVIGEQIYASQSRPAVLMPGEEDLKQYITNLLYKARDNGADVLNETSFDSWQEEQESRFCQRKR